MNWKYYKSKFEYEEIFQDYYWSWAGHKNFAYDLVRNTKPEVIVELGTHKGTSFFSFCQAAKDGKIRTKLYAVDTWKGDKHTGFYDDSIFQAVSDIMSSYYKKINANLMRMTFDEALPSFPDASIDILHIDGLHTYKAVKHDFDTWLPKVKNDGIILFHDIAVTQFKDFAVDKIWNELKKSNKTLEFHHSGGLGVLFKDANKFSRLEHFQKDWRAYYAALAAEKLLAYKQEEQLKKDFTFDQYGRYAIIRDIINANKEENRKFEILDVGGGGNIMKKFLPNDNVFYLQPSGDIQDDNYIKGDGCDMPLGDNSFDWVVSADTFEHIPKEGREIFLEENMRVAKLAVILAAPFFSPEVYQAEVRANESHKILFGEDHFCLKEHIENVLPKEKIVVKAIKDKNYAFQKISHNNLLLWELYIGSVVNFTGWNRDFLKEELEDLNLFYNTKIFPCDFCEPAYRKIYFIKKDKKLNDLKINTASLSTSIFLEAIQKWVDFVNKVNKKYDLVKQKKVEEISETLLERSKLFQQKDQEVNFMKSSKFWKLRNAYMKLKKIFSRQ